MNPTIVNKLHPSRYRGIEDKMIAIIAYILEQDWPTRHPRIKNMFILREGEVVGRVWAVMEGHYVASPGSDPDWRAFYENSVMPTEHICNEDLLRFKWEEFLDYATRYNGLTHGERQAVEAAYYRRVPCDDDKGEYVDE